MPLSSLLAIPGALKSIIDIIDRLRNNKSEVEQAEIDAVKLYAKDIDEVVRQINTHIDKIERWKFFHHVTQQICFAELQTDFFWWTRVLMITERSSTNPLSGCG